MASDFFDIQLTAPNLVRVIASPSGDTTTARPLQLNIPEFLAHYQQTLVHPTVEKNDLIVLGTDLFEALFDISIARLFFRSLGALQTSGRRLHLRLRIEADPDQPRATTQLRQLPWEILYNAAEGGFLATQQEFSISRYLPVPKPLRPLRMGLPMRILVLISAPTDLAALDFEREQKVIKSAMMSLAATDGVELVFETNATRENLLTRLQSETFHVLHFVGHGGWQNQQGVVALTHQDGQSDLVAGQIFAEMLAACPTLRLVTLNACQTAIAADGSGLGGVGEQLIQHGLPAVIAMGAAIQDKIAISFVKHLFGNLASGKPIDLALTLTRQQLHLDHSEAPGAFGIPVLYLHAPDGNLFTIMRSRKKRLVRVAQQMARLNGTSEALTEWKELHDILQMLSKAVDSVYQMALNHQSISFIPWVWSSFQQDLDSRLLPFAAERVRFIGRRFTLTDAGPSGEEWVVRTMQLAKELAAAISEQVGKKIREDAGELRTLLFRHMSICNRQMIKLLEQTNQLYEDARTMLESVHMEEENLSRPTLNWEMIDADLQELERHNRRISEWVHFHDIFDSLHIEAVKFYSQILLENSIDPIAPAWEILRNTLISGLLERAEKIAYIGTAYVEFANGSLQGDPWIIDIKRKSDQISNLIASRDNKQTQESISNLRKMIERQYLQIDKNITVEMSEFTLRSVALQARVTP
jgi:CHAT domain-containing protein